MRRPLALLVALLLLPAAAHAEPSAPIARLVLRALAGYERALGEADPWKSLADLGANYGAFGFAVSAVHRSGFELGGSFDMALRGLSGSASTQSLRFGALAAYHLRPSGRIDPWLGAGLGVQWLRHQEDGYTKRWWAPEDDPFTIADLSVRYRALPELSLSLGVDFGGEHLRIGPVLRGSLARYQRLRAEYTCPDPCPAGGDDDLRLHHRPLHGFLLVGVRGSLAP